MSLIKRECGREGLQSHFPDPRRNVGPIRFHPVYHSVDLFAVCARVCFKRSVVGHTMMNTISILGSTGSIGRQTLDVAEQLGLQVAALTANSNVERMEAAVPEVPSPPGGADGGGSCKGTGSSLAGHVCKGVGRYRCSGGRRRDPGGGNGSHRRGGHGGTEAHAGRHPGEKAHRPGQQGDAGVRRGTGDGRRRTRCGAEIVPVD